MTNKLNIALVIIVVLLIGTAIGLWFYQPEPQQRLIYPQVTIAPEDLDRLQNEAYKVCAEYDNLDLSGMVTMCRLVHYQN